MLQSTPQTRSTHDNHPYQAHWQPQTISDERGKWRSSIYRTPILDPLYLQTRGLAGDQVADVRHHGSPDQAVCCHPLNHYPFWNGHYQLEGEAQLGPGAVGENWTVANADETDFAVGDIFQVGEAVVQVSAPRFPCYKQERKLKLPNFLNLVQKTKRTGFYLRVLAPGLVQAGAAFTLLERPYATFTLKLINEQTFATPDKTVVGQLLALPELAENWKNILRRNLEER